MSEQSGSGKFEGAGGFNANAEIITRLEAIQAATARLEQGQGAADIAIKNLEAGQKQLRVDLMNRMDGHKNQLTEIRDNLAVNYGAADHVRRANDNTRDELRSLAEVIATMERQIRSLQNEVREIKGE